MSRTLASTIDAFNEAFSNQQLDEVMSFFADDCEFRQLDGTVATGREAVREVIAHVFSGALGQMNFVEISKAVDEDARRVCFRWTCRHTVHPSQAEGAVAKATASTLRVLYGETFYWEGMDLFEFDEQLRITSKQSFGKTRMPRFIRGLPAE